VDFTFEGYNTSHQIPVYGLYAGEVNEVVLTATAEDGSKSKTTLQIKTDPLPPELEKDIIICDLVSPEAYQPGLNFTYFKKTAFDVNGDYRWFYRDFLLKQPTLYNEKGNLVVIAGEAHEGDALLYELNLLGRILSVYYSPYGAHHDITDIDGGNLLVTGSRGATVEDLIYEIEAGSDAPLIDIDTAEALSAYRMRDKP
jgi:hypothetical protein